MTDDMKKVVKEQTDSLQTQDVLEVVVDGKLNMGDLRSSQPVTSERRLAQLERTINAMHSQAQKREDTRSHIVNGILSLAFVVVLGSGAMVGIAAFRPNADSDSILSWTQVSLYTLTNLGSTAMAFYFGTQKSKD